jgi:hypothetical protein
MWLRKHWVGLAGILLPALYLYLQIQVWKQQGYDFSIVTLGILGTVGIWVFMIVAMSRYWSDTKHAESLRSQIVSIKDDCETRINGLRATNLRELEDQRTHLIAECERQKAEAGVRYQQELPQKLPTPVLRGLSPAERNQIEMAGVLINYKHQAAKLHERLRSVWSAFGGDHRPTNYDDVIYLKPLADVVTDLGEPRFRSLFEFQMLYKNHIAELRLVLPDFHTNTIDDGFPNESKEYLQILRDLEAHQVFLLDRAEKMLLEAG